MQYASYTLYDTLSKRSLNYFVNVRVIYQIIFQRIKFSRRKLELQAQDGLFYRHFLMAYSRKIKRSIRRIRRIYRKAMAVLSRVALDCNYNKLHCNRNIMNCRI